MDLTRYQDQIQLFTAYQPPEVTNIQADTLLDQILNDLKHPEMSGLINRVGKRECLKVLLTIAPAHSLPQECLDKIDQLLQIELANRKLTTPQDIAVLDTVSGTDLSLWRGDITTLKVDAITNAANNQLLGCFQPFHPCIDNAIHCRSGPRLRDDCQRIMQIQGHLEATGRAKITKAYNLPSAYVLHTVGPIAHSGVTPTLEQDLANCYTHCLDLVKTIPAIRSVAFCSISTGVFGYPIHAASRVAIASVKNWLESNPGHLDYVIFNVFSPADQATYEAAFKELS